MKKFLFISLLFLAVACHKSELRESDADRVDVSFLISGVVADVMPTPRAADGSVTTPPTTSGIVNLDKDATVRILAFQRKGSSADIASDTQVSAPYGEATYVVQADGSLKPCVVDADGKVVASAATPASIRLRAGTYDFYAFTPAAEIAKSGADKYKVAIKHATDHAASLTTAVIPSGVEKHPVTLTTLDRKCSKLSFSIERKSTSSAIRSIKVDTIYVNRIAASPSTPSLLLKALDVSTKTNTGFFVLPEGEVTYDSVGKVTPYDCFGVVLPKTEEDFDFNLTVRFNDTNNNKNQSVLPTAKVPAMAFNPGYHYNFKVVLKGSIITLILQVQPWGSEVDWGNLEMGASPGVDIVVGDWNVENWDDFEVGSGSDASIDIGGWNPSPTWSEDIGADPVLSGALTSTGWNSGSSDTGDIGSGSTAGSTPGNWGNGVTGSESLGD
ncbi:MAG: fimbrillin family protein [Alistipes sp.]|nr:fimbrillin family protein [Alistipes sp.]